MNRQQALNQLRIMRDWHEDNGNGPNADYDAICYAIEAIERSEDLEKLREMQSATDINVGTKETIYRQDAIDALAEQMPQPYTPDGSHPADKGIFMAQEIYADCIQTLEDLPPAQPEPCEDAVSRKAVIDTIDEWKEACVDSGHKETASDIMLIRKDFIEVPPVTPKQRTGYWYPVGMAEAVGGESAQWGSAIAYHKCSECNEQALCEFGQEILSKFCPHCGAKMEGDAE